MGLVWGTDRSEKYEQMEPPESYNKMSAFEKFKNWITIQRIFHPVRFYTICVSLLTIITFSVLLFFK